MTASEKILRRAQRNQADMGAGDIGYHISRVRQDDPGLAFQADREFAGLPVHKSHFSNSKPANPQLAESMRNEVAKAMRDHGLDYDAARQHVRVFHPEFANVMDNAPILSAAPGSDTGGGVTAADQRDAQSLGLPLDASAEELGWARSANTTDKVKLFAEMVAKMQTLKGYSSEGAQGFCIGRYPMLAQAARAAGKIESVVNHSSQGKSQSADNFKPASF